MDKSKFKSEFKFKREWDCKEEEAYRKGVSHGYDIGFRTKDEDCYDVERKIISWKYDHENFFGIPTSLLENIEMDIPIKIFNDFSASAAKQVINDERLSKNAQNLWFVINNLLSSQLDDQDEIFENLITDDEVIAYMELIHFGYAKIPSFLKIEEI